MLKLKCKHCKRKGNYQMTRTAYDDMEYLGRYEVRCKSCSRRFGVRLDGFNVRVAK